MQESILSSALRAFFKAFFSLLGIFLAFIPLMLILGFFMGTSETTPDSDYSITYLPNAEGDRKVVSSKAPVILSLPIVGVIGVDGLTMHSIRQMLVESREGTLDKNRVKAILLHIETPGGTVVDADGIYHAIKSYKEQYKVPVYAYVDGMCASGGMYIAAAADKVYASSVSLVGSIGVLIPGIFNVSKLMDTIGVKALTLSAGKGKDELNPLRPWVPGEDASMQTIVNDYYQQFVNIVTTNRPQLNKEKLIQDYGAHVFLAAQAQEYGFIDGAGKSRNETIKMLLQELNLENEEYQIVEMESKSWYHALFSAQAPWLTGKVTHKLQITPELDPALLNKVLYLYQPGM